MPPDKESEQNTRMPVLSLILCSRNDRYMGNSLWRLQTSLNCTSKAIQELGREGDVEILVADWGSEIPLHDVVELTPAAARITSFSLIPPALARRLQRDSPFPEVLALNVAARRAKGQFIGRIDQDTIVGPRFLRALFDLHEGGRQSELPLESTIMFSNVRIVPFRLTSHCPPLATIDRFVRGFWRWLPIENARSRSPFYMAAVGIMLLHRDLWAECGGYDERMIYMNGMETNMVRRLARKYGIVDLGRLVDYDFFHLEHYHPLEARKSSSYRKVNPHLPFSSPDELSPNGRNWGLSGMALPTGHATRRPVTVTPTRAGMPFALLAVRVWLRVCADRTHAMCAKWARRIGVVWQAVRDQPIVKWPEVVRHLVIEKSSGA